MQILAHSSYLPILINQLVLKKEQDWTLELISKSAMTNKLVIDKLAHISEIIYLTEK